MAFTVAIRRPHREYLQGASDADAGKLSYGLERFSNEGERPLLIMVCGLRHLLPLYRDFVASECCGSRGSNNGTDCENFSNWTPTGTEFQKATNTANRNQWRTNAS